MNKEKLIEHFDFLTENAKTKILDIANKEIEKLKTHHFVPKEGELYYAYAYTCAYGEITSLHYAFTNSLLDGCYIKTGNCFRSHEEAIFAGNCDYYTKCFETCIDKHTEKLDWQDKKQLKHYAYYNSDSKEVRFCHDYLSKAQGTVYASSDEILKNAITDIGEENFLKYVMKVEK